VKSKIIMGVAFLSISALLLGACTPIPGPVPTPIPIPAPVPMPTPIPLPTLSGTLKVYVTDAPPRDEVTSVNVTISEVQVHKAVVEQEREQEQSGSDNQTQEQEKDREQQQTQQGESEWISIDLSDNATTFDLLKIKGIEQFLGSNELAAGKYTQVRLVVDTIKVTLGNQEPQDAEVPSKELKLVHPFDIVAGETTALVLDFDADKMVTVTGAGKIIVKPVIKLSTKQISSTGKPEGTREEKTEALEFEGTIEVIDGSTWTMTIDGETRIVDVSDAEIEGEPEAGLKAKVEGIEVDERIVASEVEIEEPGTSQEETVEQESVEVSCDDFMADKHISKELEVYIGGSFIVTLCSNPTTGFQWSESAQISDPAVMEQVNHEFLPPGKKGAVGASGEEIWTFKALKEGESTISMEYSRPWKGGEKGEWTFILTVSVK